MAACSSRCRRSKTYSFATGVNVVTVPFNAKAHIEPLRCFLCNKVATLSCGLCHVTAYCSKACVLHDYYRHRYECKLHCPRLQLFQDFERCQAPGLRIKHTGYRQLGVGVFSRRAYNPGDRIIEDVVQHAEETPCRCARIMKYVRPLNTDGAFKRNSEQQLRMTKGYHGFWSLFFNHSCMPNAIIEVSDCRKFLLVTAIKSIDPGHEICFSYFRASYIPLSLRSPSLIKVLGRPCICLVCLMAKPMLEQGFNEMWHVVRHAYGGVPYELLEHQNGEVDLDLTYAIANRILDIAFALFGINLRAADPWLAYIYNAIVIYIEETIKLKSSDKMLEFLSVLRQDAAVASDYLGFCTNMTIVVS